MSYIFRFYKWLFDTIINLAKEVIVFTIRQVFSFIRFAWPYILWTIVGCIGTAFWLCLLNFIALFQPVRSVAETTANNWSVKAVEDGWFPSLHEPTLRKVLYYTAFAAINAGFFLNLFMMTFMTVTIWENREWLISLF
jgi:hypothetical protein